MTEAMRLPSMVLHAHPGRAQLLLDGHDVSYAISGVTVSCHVGQLPVVTVQLAVHPLDVDGEAVILIPEPTQRMLITLGWTPPTEP
jgi:hypothetical protein